MNAWILERTCLRFDLVQCQHFASDGIGDFIEETLHIHHRLYRVTINDGFDDDCVVSVDPKGHLSVPGVQLLGVYCFGLIKKRLQSAILLAQAFVVDLSILHIGLK